MQLLAQLHPLLPQRSGSSLLHLRQLWPFLRHNLDSVRLASVNLYTGLVASSGNTGMLTSQHTYSDSTMHILRLPACSCLHP